MSPFDLRWTYPTGYSQASHGGGLLARTPGNANWCLLSRVIPAKAGIQGNNAEFTVELHEPVALAEHSRFAIREGGRTVGAGVVTRIEE